jgi:hypothetical protein
VSSELSKEIIGLPTDYQKFIHLIRYARYSEELGRRETWEETVDRYFNFFEKHLTENFPNAVKEYNKVRKELEIAVINLEVMPSMRCLMTAGKALERDAVAGYNCSFLAVDNPRAFDECGVRDRLGGRASLLVTRGTQNLDFDKPRNPLPVLNDHAGEGAGDFIESFGKNGERRSHTAESIGKEDHRVIGAHVAINRDPVEGIRDRAFEVFAENGLSQRGVGGEHAKHGGHVRIDQEVLPKLLAWQNARVIQCFSNFPTGHGFGS